MKELQHLGGTVVLADEVVSALEQLAASLASVQMSASIQLRTAHEASGIMLEIGHDHTRGRKHVLHAKPAQGEGSHLGLEDI